MATYLDWCFLVEGPFKVVVKPTTIALFLTAFNVESILRNSWGSTMMSTNHRWIRYLTSYLDLLDILNFAYIDIFKLGLCLLSQFWRRVYVWLRYIHYSFRIVFWLFISSINRILRFFTIFPDCSDVFQLSFWNMVFIVKCIIWYVVSYCCENFTWVWIETCSPLCSLFLVFKNRCLNI